jgi:hypothetical protein
MKGVILGYDLKTTAGILRADNGNRYSFDRNQWHSQAVPAAGMEVDFEPSGDVAHDVFPLGGAHNAGTTNVTGVGGNARGESRRQKLLPLTVPTITAIAAVIAGAIFLLSSQMGGIDDNELLATANFDQPIHLNAQLNALYGNDGRFQEGANPPTIGLLVSSGVVTVQPSLDAAPWWHFNVEAGRLSGEQVSVVFAQRQLLGRSEVRRWSDNGSDYFAETVSYNISIDQRFNLLTNRTQGPFLLRLVAVNDPRASHWSVSSLQYLGRQGDNVDEAHALMRLVTSVGSNTLAELQNKIGAARASAFNSIAQQLATDQILLPDPNNGDVLISPRNHLAFLKRLVPFTDTNIATLIGYCRGVQMQGYGQWRVASRSDLSGVLRTQAQYYPRLMDAPDGRLWGAIATPLSSGNGGSASIITSDVSDNAGNRYSIYSLPATAYAPFIEGYRIAEDGSLDGPANGGSWLSNGDMRGLDMLNANIHRTQGRILCVTNLTA